ncbi:MAG: formyltetrahydrofolate deformylase [Deltaproteobacteria bacterium]|nr:formyltetrahydrofolate deformylase [Deltaproteobacteria bacterium]
MKQQHILLTDCQDSKGLVSSISTELYNREVNILSNREFVDPVTGHFFMRTAFEGSTDNSNLLAVLKNLLPENANVRLATKRKKRIVVLATKEPHCLGDLLIRTQYNDLNATIEAVIANRAALGPLVEKFKVPFHLVSHQNKDRVEHAMEISDIIDSYAPDYIVLAKYMRILPQEFVNKFNNKIINIHHSFLPAFIGASPYKQAYERGVKIIGATAHFVTGDLDMGPIIEQDVISTNHRMTSKLMAKAGMDVEKIVLARAVSKVVDDRVFVSGNKTVIFD